MKHIGDLAKDVLIMNAQSRRGQVISGPWPSEDERDRMRRTEWAMLSRALLLLCARSEKKIGIVWVRAAVAAVLAEIDEKIARDSESSEDAAP